MDRIVHPPVGTDPLSGAVSGRRSGASGAGRADGGIIGPDRGQGCSGGPDFALSVPPNGYAWWYLDALSDDGQFGLTIIAFVGSVFSPYYARARRRGTAAPENHVAVNIALYGKGVRRWTMTERGRSALDRTRDTLRIGPSQMHWNGKALELSLDELSVPMPGRVRGTVRVVPQCLPSRAFVLDQAGRHLWQPIAPMARADVRLSSPDLQWSGHAYFDHNHGTEPLEDGFESWDWSRQNTGNSARILYDVVRRGGANEILSVEVLKDGRIAHFESPPRAGLPPAFWRVSRSTRCDDGALASVVQTLEDAPFYARSLIRSSINGDKSLSVHESLDLNRFRSTAVQAMLLFKMPRRTF
jgi:carotenoid 1,2-hydratase